MSKTSLNKVIGKRALAQHFPGEQWPIPEQFIGLEIEMEHLNRAEQMVHENAGRPFWEPHQDGSLRNGIEYVLAEPLMGSQLSKAISYFFGTFKTYTISPRTSIHVHVNMRQDEDSVEGLKNLLVLYYMYEEAFFQYADINRKWCAYCNPFEDNTPSILVDVLRFEPNNPKHNGLLNAQLRNFAGANVNRYYGLNIAGLERFGTLEFRHFPLVKNEEALNDWITFIMELKLASRKLADEGRTVSDVVSGPDDIQQLAPYFPRFWHVLTQHVAAKDAYLRMVGVMGLVLPQMESLGETLEGNPAWTRFLDEQKSRGKTLLEPGKKKVGTKLHWDEGPPIEAQFDADMDDRIPRAEAAPPAPLIPPGAGFAGARLNNVWAEEARRIEDDMFAQFLEPRPPVPRPAARPVQQVREVAPRPIRVQAPRGPTLAERRAAADARFRALQNNNPFNNNRG